MLWLVARHHPVSSATMKPDKVKVWKLIRHYCSSSPIHSIFVRGSAIGAGETKQNASYAHNVRVFGVLIYMRINVWRYKIRPDRKFYYMFLISLSSDEMRF